MTGILPPISDAGVEWCSPARGNSPHFQTRRPRLELPRVWDFPEISPERVKHIFGLQVTISTDANSQEEGLELFKLLGFPLKSE